MTINIGDFIKTSLSQHPCCVISKNDKCEEYLVSLKEFGGDYKWVKDVKKINLNEFQKLKEISKYNNWWYVQHKDIYQSILIVFLTNR
jgi:hypothetical protein